MDKVLSGCNLSALPKVSSNVVKIYVASTKDDFVIERQRLWQDTLPELQHHLLNDGLEVELIDIHQGSRLNHATNTQLFDSHLQLIKHCHKVSMGVFFICLIGNKHGRVPLPPYLEEYEFKPFREEAQLAGKDVKLLERWYLKDNNAIPPVYTLRPVTDLYPTLHVGYFQKTARFDRELKEWEKIYAELLDLLQHSATVCYKDGKINQAYGHRQQRFFMSTVEQEVQQALQMSLASPLMVCRTFDSIVWKHKAISSYINMSPGGEVDVEEQQRHNRSKEIISKKIPEANKMLFTVPWKQGGLCPDSCEQHMEYLDDFHTSIIDTVLSMVEKQRQLRTPVSSYSTIPQTSGLQTQLYQNVQVHMKYCRKILRRSNPRPRGFEELEEKIRKLMCIYSKQEHSPIIIHGPEGCGKSVLTSRIAEMVGEHLGKNTILIYRYARLTSTCKTMYSILYSICCQLEYILDRSKEVKSLVFQELVMYYKALVNNLKDYDNNVVIIIDGIHNLRPNPKREPDTGSIDWLAETLPPHVHLIITMLDNNIHKETFNALVGQLDVETGEGCESVFKVPSLKESQIHQIIKDSFQHPRRKLTVEQEQAVVDACIDSGNPLHIKLCIEDALKLPSYMPVTNKTFKTSLDSALNQRFNKLDSKYGEELISLIVYNLCACSIGLTEMEFLDILSCNNNALLRVFQHFDLSSDNYDSDVLLRFPSSLWWSIRSDFGCCLQDMYIDGKRVLAWSHSMVGQNAIQRYKPTMDVIKQTHHNIAALFQNSWIGNKPMVVPNKGIEIIDTGNRFVCQQPMLYNETTYNYRKLQELWFQLLHAGDMMSFKEDTLCNFEYLLAQLHSTSVNNIMSDLDMISAHVLDSDLALVRQVVHLSAQVLSQDPLQLAAELIGRIRQIKEFFPNHMEILVQQCMEWCDSYTLPILVPLSSWLPDPQQTLVKTITCSEPIELIATTKNSQHLFCTTSGFKVLMYHIASGSQIRVLEGPKGRITTMCLAHCGQILYCGSEDSTIHVWEISTGALIDVIKDHTDAILCLALTQLGDLLVTGSNDNSAKVICIKTGEIVHNNTSFVAPVSCVVLTSGDSMLITASEKELKVWHMDDMTLMNTIEGGIPSPIRTLALSQDNTFLIIACEDKSITVKAFTTGSDVHSLDNIHYKAEKIVISEDSKHCVIAGSDGIVYTYNFRTKALVSAIEAASDNLNSYPVTGLQTACDEHFILSACHSQISVCSFFKEALKDYCDDHHSDIVTCMTMSKDGKTGITGSRDCSVKLWNLEISDFIASWEGHEAQVTCVDIASDDTFGVSGSEDTTVKVWSVIMGCVITDYMEHRATIAQVTTLLNPSRVISTDDDGFLKTWTAEDGETLWSMDTALAMFRLSPSGTHVVSGNPEQHLRVWILEDGLPIGQKIHHNDTIYCVTFSEDSQYLVTGATDHSLKVWETCTAKLTQVLVEHDNLVSCAAITNDNSYVLSGSYDRRLLVWGLSTGAVEQQLLGHTLPVTCVKVTDDSTVAISGSKDGTLRVWSISQGTQITLFDMHHPVLSLYLNCRADRIMVHLENSPHVPLMCLHNSPAGGIKSQHDIEVTMCNDNAVLPLKPRSLVPHVGSKIYTLPKKHLRQPSVSTIPEIIKISPIKKTPLQVTIKAQEVNQEKRIAREMSSVGSSSANVKEVKKNKQDSNKTSPSHSSLCVIL